MTVLRGVRTVKIGFYVFWGVETLGQVQWFSTPSRSVLLAC